MITRCPGCTTHFRVHADQLAARAGQVRCGKCSKVFNALDELIEEPIPAIPQAPRATHELPSSAAVQIAPEKPAGDIAVPNEQSAERAQNDGKPDPERRLAEISAPRQPEETRIEPAPIPEAWGFGPAAAIAATAKVRRWPWLTGALLLFLILLAQAAYHYRTAIVLLVPESKPWFVELCQTIGCDLPLPQRIELMSIEASDLQADTTNPNVMVLSATLKNRAIFSQQLPLLELTLTDAQDQPVVRRVLLPQDYLGKPPPEAGFNASSEIALKVFIEGS